MDWFSTSDYQHPDWVGYDERNAQGILVEATSATCARCESDVDVIVEFGELKAVRIVLELDGSVLARWDRDLATGNNDGDLDGTE